MHAAYGSGAGGEQPKFVGLTRAAEVARVLGHVQSLEAAPRAGPAATGGVPRDLRERPAALQVTQIEIRALSITGAILRKLTIRRSECGRHPDRQPRAAS